MAGQDHQAFEDHQAMHIFHLIVFIREVILSPDACINSIQHYTIPIVSLHDSGPHHCLIIYLLIQNRVDPELERH